MKKIFLLLAIITFTGMASAQEKAESKVISEKKMDKKSGMGMMDEILGSLNLTDEQKEKINQIEKEHKVKVEAIKATGKAQDFKNLNEERFAAIDAVLTPEQKEKRKEEYEKRTAEKMKRAEMKTIQ